jgi:prepilin-type N-terminal cleavage/methylation domain-containing protein
MKRVRLSNKVGKILPGKSRGFTLIEVLIALALFAIIGIVFAGGLATASRAVLIADVRTNAESLARTEMEYVKTQEYSAGNWSYVVTHLESICTPDCPSWWTTNPAQEITVTVRHEDRRVITLVGYKIDR